MGKSIKVIFITLFVSLVIFAAIADRPIVEQLLGGLHLAPYLRIISVLGLIIAVFTAWGYKRKIEASQKIVRAQEILTQAGETGKPTVGGKAQSRLRTKKNAFGGTGIADEEGV